MFFLQLEHHRNGASLIEKLLRVECHLFVTRSMAGLMGVTAFLSMWINNSAAASIMLPVALAICKELEQHAKDNHRRKHDAIAGKTMSITRFICFLFIFVDRFESKEIESTSNGQVMSTTVVKTGCLACCHRTHGSTVDQLLDKRYKELQKGFLLAVAYSATIGGLSTLVGTGTNVYAKSFIDKYFSLHVHVK